MLQSFTGILENGQIIWEEPKKLPNHAKVVVTVLEEIEKQRPPKTLGQFMGVWSDMSKEEKDSFQKHITTIRNEWERLI